ncbi:MAG: UDP-glucose 4-epimerase GalE [Candidatus Melainabacteria bacterium]|nr:UDP-glucose 4-epimerase GalE [Candidatus Melainabacteria bacterium]
MILVTGGLGYVGSHFLKTYLSKYPGSGVVVVDDLSTGHTQALDVCDGAILVKADIGNIEQMQGLLAKFSIEAVIHFAASTLVAESQKNPSHYFENNVVKSLNLFKAMEKAGVKKIVFSSSCAIYGYPKSVPLIEEHVLDPINVYGLTKLLVEKALEAYAKTSDWSYIALRYFNASGADDGGLIGESHNPETHLLPLIFKTALEKQECIEIYGNEYDTRDGTCIRDYIHVNDLAQAHCLALEKLEAQLVCLAINLGSTHGTSVKEALDICQRVVGRTIASQVRPPREGDPPTLVANNDKAVAYLGWKPQYDFQRIVETAWHWEQHRRY